MLLPFRNGIASGIGSFGLLDALGAGMLGARREGSTTSAPSEMTVLLKRWSEERASAVGVSLATAKRDLRTARAWLASQLRSEPLP